MPTRAAKKHRRKDPLADVAFEVQGTVICLRKSILALASPFFQALFEDTEIKVEEPIKLDCELVAFKLMVDMLYPEKAVILSEEVVNSLISLALRWDVPKVTGRCIEFINSSPNPCVKTIFMADQLGAAVTWSDEVLEALFLEIQPWGKLGDEEIVSLQKLSLPSLRQFVIYIARHHPCKEDAHRIPFLDQCPNQRRKTAMPITTPRPGPPATSSFCAPMVRASTSIASSFATDQLSSEPCSAATRGRKPSPCPRLHRSCVWPFLCSIPTSRTTC